MKKIKPELVLPGGDLERTKIALDYGADAVYVGLNKYSLRKGEVRFDIPEIAEAIKYAHASNKKIYITFNIFAHNEHLKATEKDMAKVAKLNPDAFIVADIGVIRVAKKVAPKIPIHVSTQANTTNVEGVRFWKGLGVRRVVLARELTLKEIAEIHKAVPEIELEAFAHGSMCISYSGRCLLSNYMTGRHSNLGDCAQPCRWNYKLKQLPIDQLHQLSITSDGKGSKFNMPPNAKYYLEENQRPGEYFEIEEIENGTNILSSKDLRTVEYLDEMLKAGITGFKVEGRNKTEYYLAATALAYREGLDLAYANKYTSRDKKRLAKELEKVAHRGYTSGFLFEEAEKGATYEGRSPIEQYRYIAQITNIKHQKTNEYEVLVKNKIQTGMDVEILTPTGVKQDRVLGINIEEKKVAEINPGKENQSAVVKLKNSYPVSSLVRTVVS